MHSLRGATTKQETRETADETYCRLARAYDEMLKVAFSQQAHSSAGEATVAEAEAAYFDFARENFQQLSKHNLLDYRYNAECDEEVNIDEIEACLKVAVSRDDSRHPKVDWESIPNSGMICGSVNTNDTGHIRNRA